MHAQPDHAILDFWFGPFDEAGAVSPERRQRWWTKSETFDTLCRESFESELVAAVAGEREELKSSARGSLAFILLCDQVSRNIYRDTPGAFASDPLALATTRVLIESPGYDALRPAEKSFALMPLMHSEDLAVHELSLKYFEALKAEGQDNLNFAEQHKAIIARFGRYPHRNAILGRTSTPEESEFLTKPGSSF